MHCKYTGDGKKVSKMKKKWLYLAHHLELSQALNKMVVDRDLENVSNER